MTGLLRHMKASAILLRLALAVALVVVSSLQPVLFVSAGGKHHETAALVLVTDAGSGHHADAHRKHHVSTETDRHSTDQTHLKRFSDKSCEIHCAPVTALPVDCPAFGRAPGACHGTVAVAVLLGNAYGDFARPPRT